VHVLLLAPMRYYALFAISLFPLNAARIYFASSSLRLFPSFSLSLSLSPSSLRTFFMLSQSFLSHARMLSLASRCDTTLFVRLYITCLLILVFIVSRFSTRKLCILSRSLVLQSHMLSSLSFVILLSSLLFSRRPPFSYRISVCLCATREMEMRRWKSTITDSDDDCSTTAGGSLPHACVLAGTRARARASR